MFAFLFREFGRLSDSLNLDFVSMSAKFSVFMLIHLYRERHFNFFSFL